MRDHGTLTKQSMVGRDTGHGILGHTSAQTWLRPRVKLNPDDNNGSSKGFTLGRRSVVFDRNLVDYFLISGHVVGFAVQRAA